MSAAAALSKEADRAQFAAQQVEFNRSWYANLLNSGKDVDAYVNLRKAAYLTRWREAGRYTGAGGRILDIGGGNLYPELLSYFRSMNWDYWYMDVGEGEMAGSRQLAGSVGFDPSHFACGMNHELHYADESFDAVFSSHCLEHSMDLKLTLLQLNRILRSGGNIVASIPLGFDAQPNHPYFLLENEWLALFEDAGFRIRAYQIGDEYPENGHDLMIAAEKSGPPAAQFRLDPADYVKTRFQFRDCRAPEIAYFGERIEGDDRIIMTGTDWTIAFPLAVGVTEALPVLHRHNWSGVVCVESGPDKTYGDLYRPHAAVQPLRLRLSEPAEPGRSVRITPVGRNETSFAAQGVFAGYLSR